MGMGMGMEMDVVVWHTSMACHIRTVRLKPLMPTMNVTTNMEMTSAENDH